MYLVIKETQNNNKFNQIPLRLYEDVYKAYNFVQNYIAESSGEYSIKNIIPSDITKRYIINQRWFLKYKNGKRDTLKIRYFKVFWKESRGKINGKNRKIKKIFTRKLPQYTAFNTRNIAGDYMENVYDKDNIQVDYCPYYEYIEIFGLTDKEFEELLDKKAFLGSCLKTFSEYVK